VLVNFAETITITRHNPGDYVDGEWAAGAYVAGEFEPAEAETFEVEISGHIQPINIKKQGDLQLMQLFGVQHPQGLIRILSNDELWIVDKEAKTRGDIIPHDGRNYELQIVSKHPKFPPTHWAGVALLVDEKTAYP